MAEVPSEKKAKIDLADEESYLLRASFKSDDKVFREIVIGAHHTLGQLEEVLLAAIGYNLGTLNAFYLDGKPLSKAPGVLFYSVAGPPPHMSTKSIKQANPVAGGDWVYMYDLQADTPVEITINTVEVRPIAKAVEAPSVTKSEGTAPPAPAEPADHDEAEISSGEDEEEEDDGDNYEESVSEDESSEEKPKRKASMQRAGSKRGRKGDDSDE